MYKHDVIDGTDVDRCFTMEQVSKKNDVIRRLQADISHELRAADESMRRTRTEAEKQTAAEYKHSDGKLTKIQQELAQVRADYADVLTRHRDGEQALRKVGHTLLRTSTQKTPPKSTSANNSRCPKQSGKRPHRI